MKSSPGRDVAIILNSKTVSYARPAKIPIHASDGWRLCLHVVDGQEPECKAPVLVVFPALGVTSGTCVRMALSLVKKGYRLVLVDLSFAKVLAAFDINNIGVALHRRAAIANVRVPRLRTAFGINSAALPIAS